ncbi:hypothetical protein C8J56DRAFT_972453 [Mycena floridula]|nr:hypothetical protein C8J56DRAFT_972453 [Mycena floridula]
MCLTILLVFSYLHLASSSPNSGPRRLNSRSLFLECPSEDDAGSSVIDSGVDESSGLSTCTYNEAGLCTYFSVDGSFSSGASICPNVMLTVIPGGPNSRISLVADPASTSSSHPASTSPSATHPSPSSASVKPTSSSTTRFISTDFATGSSIIKTDQGVTKTVPTLTLFSQTFSTDIVAPNSTFIAPPDIPSVSHPVHKPNNVPIIAGSTVGVAVVIAAVIGTLIIRWRRRKRMLYLKTSRYEPSVAENTRIGPSRFARKRPRNIDESSGVTHDRQIRAEKDPTASNTVTVPREQTERLRSLQAQAVQIERQIADSQAALSSVPDAAPEFTRALMTENIRLNVEIQALRDLNWSDWPRGLTDVPPPSYPHSETSSL